MKAGTLGPWMTGLLPLAGPPRQGHIDGLPEPQASIGADAPHPEPTWEPGEAGGALSNWGSYKKIYGLWYKMYMVYGIEFLVYGTEYMVYGGFCKLGVLSKGVSL